MGLPRFNPYMRVRINRLMLFIVIAGLSLTVSNTITDYYPPNPSLEAPVVHFRLGYYPTFVRKINRFLWLPYSGSNGPLGRGISPHLAQFLALLLIRTLVGVSLHSYRRSKQLPAQDGQTQNSPDIRPPTV